MPPRAVPIVTSPPADSIATSQQATGKAYLVDPNRYPLCLGRRRLPNSNAGKSFGKPGAQHAVLSLRACLDGLFRDALISMQGEAMQVFTRERVAGNFVPELPGQKLLCLAAKLLRRLRLSGDDPYDATVERLHVDGRGALRAYGRPAVVPPPGCRSTSSERAYTTSTMCKAALAESHLSLTWPLGSMSRSAPTSTLHVKASRLGCEGAVAVAEGSSSWA
eukprot:scaffold307_cov390-Prasinococcus_capsulatus_cf.AAC.9